MNEMLQKGSFSTSKDGESCQAAKEASGITQEFKSDNLVESSAVNGEKDGLLQHLEPYALQILYRLVSLVHDSVQVVGQDQLLKPTTTEGSSSDQSSVFKENAKDNSSLFENDHAADIFLSLEPLILRKVLLTMVCSFPRTLEAFILHMLGPKGAEVLTRKFDEMDQQTTKEQQEEFYKLFYSVFEDPHAAMDAILGGKELFAFQAFRNVLDQYLGVHVCQPE